MAKTENQLFRLRRPAAPLPSEADFDPFGGGRDAQSAWKNFGELSLKQAYDLFVTNPSNYQEDFMLMGSMAFGYYFPVIDRYIREVSGEEAGDDCEVAILGSGVAAQFACRGSRFDQCLIAEIGQLSDYVSSHLAQYSPSAKDHRRIMRAWGLVDKNVAEYKTKSEQADAANSSAASNLNSTSSVRGSEDF